MGTTVTKKDMISRVAEQTGERRAVVKKVVQEFLDQVVIDLGEDNRLEFRDFGVFEIKERAARAAKNPKTLEPIRVPAKRTVRFKPGRKMQAYLDGEIETPSGKPREPQIAGRAQGLRLVGREPDERELVASRSETTAAQETAQNDRTEPDLHVVNGMHQPTHAT